MDANDKDNDNRVIPLYIWKKKICGCIKSKKFSVIPGTFRAGSFAEGPTFSICWEKRSCFVNTGLGDNGFGETGLFGNDDSLVTGDNGKSAFVGFGDIGEVGDFVDSGSGIIGEIWASDFIGDSSLTCGKGDVVVNWKLYFYVWVHIIFLNTTFKTNMWKNSILLSVINIMILV